MNNSRSKVLLAEGGPGEASISLRTCSTTDRCDQMWRRIVPRLLPFQESNGLRAALVFSIDDEVCSGSVLAPHCGFREAAASSEPPERSTLAIGPEARTMKAAAAQLLARFPSLPILFTSGYSEYPRLEFSQAPTSRFLQKPYSPTSLGRAIREILGHPQAQAS